MGKRTCSIKGCEGAHYCQGWCRKHYRSWDAHGHPLAAEAARHPLTRFWNKVVEATDKSPAGWTGCSVWTGAIGPNGYGHFFLNEKIEYAHRVAYEFALGFIAPDLTVDHLCRRRNCVNPSHMELVTVGENVLRGESLSANNARKTHCKRGHEFTKENTIRGRNGSRQCRTCTRAGERRRNRERRGS